MPGVTNVGRGVTRVSPRPPDQRPTAKVQDTSGNPGVVHQRRVPWTDRSGRPLVLLPTRLRPSWVGPRCPRRLGRYGATRRAGIAQRCRARRSMNRPGSQWDPSSHCAGFRSWPTAWTRKTPPDLRIRDEDRRIVVCQAVASVQVSACRLRRRRWPRPDRRRFDSRTCAWRLRVPRSYCGYELRRAVIVCSRP